MKCFYHDDLDSKCAAFWVYFSASFNDPYCALNSQDEKYIPVCDDGFVPVSDIQKDEQIYLLGFSIPIAEMYQIFEKTNNVTYITRHNVFFEEYKDFVNIPGLQNYELGVCSLTYAYLHYHTSRILENNHISDFCFSMLEKDLPYFTKAVSNWATKDYEFGGYDHLLISALNDEVLTPCSPVFINLYFNPEEKEKQLVEKGKRMLL